MEIVDGAVEVVGAFVQHAHSLIAACLVVQHDDNHISIHLLAVVGVVFEDAFSLLELVESSIGVFVLEEFDARIVDFIQQGL